jgi:hypothetical protein
MTDRTSGGLAAVMFEELEDLRTGKSTPQHARAVAALGSTICSIKRLEIDYQRFVGSARAQIEAPSLKLPMADPPG